MNDYHPVIQALEAEFARQREGVRQLLYEQGRLDLVAEFDRKMREIDTGIYSARNCWHSITYAQRWALIESAKHGGKLVRKGKEYRHPDEHQPYKPIYARTIRVLCAHNLMAWDGGIPNPEATAVITERGLFVLRCGLESKP